MLIDNITVHGSAAMQDDGLTNNNNSLELSNQERW